MSVINGFWAYPSQPIRIGQAIRMATENLNGGGLVNIRTWQDMQGTGKVLIDEICREIDAAELFCADLYDLNPNVMFELGYAIVRNKRIWPLLDTTITQSNNTLKEFETLTSIGYTPYVNHLDIERNFYQEKPFLTIDETLFKNSIEPHLTPATGHSILYLQSKYADDTSIYITRRLKESKVEKRYSDPSELAVRALTWYGTNIYQSTGVLCHLSNPERYGSKVDNAIYTLVAGMAYGFGKPLLMLIESQDEYLAPMDVRHVLRKYKKAQDIQAVLDEWLMPIEESWFKASQIQVEHKAVAKLATELKGLEFGEPQAENESASLDTYFVPTASYEDALNGKQIIFVGRKGSGKTANFLSIASTLETNPKTLVCRIQPVGYHLNALVQLLKTYNNHDTREYAIEALWKFLIYTEIARAESEQIMKRPVQTVTEDEQRLLNITLDAQGRLQDFSARLEQCVESLANLQEKTKESVDFGKAQSAISEALHAGILKEVHRSLKRVLVKRRRIAILLDDLDKSWDKQRDIEELSDFLLGLLTGSDKILNDLKRDIDAGDQTTVSLTIFLRSDIFDKIMESALEPDKIRFTRLVWNRPEVLVDLIEQRFIASHDNSVPGDEMWERYFCPEVKGLATADYITTRIIPRPRDLVLFVSQSVRAAVTSRHTMVEVEDILEAEAEYSQIALKILLVENGKTIPDFQSVLDSFVGSTPHITHEEVLDCIRGSQASAESIEEVVEQLYALGFLGVQVSSSDYRFSEDPDERRRNKILASKYGRLTNSGIRYKIHPAYWAFLAIVEE